MISLWGVRRAAIRYGMPRSKFLDAYRCSLRLCVSRLVQALYREKLCTVRLVEDPELRTCLSFGRPASLLVPIVPKPFGRLDVPGWPVCYNANRQPIRWSGSLLREFASLLEHSRVSGRMKEFFSDFQNSLSSLILNRVLNARPGVGSTALEPAYQGHHYYPFPGLRVGPSIDDVMACSHLNAKPVAVPLVEVSGLTFHSEVFSSAGECFRAWAGMHVAGEQFAIPVHPWQLKISPIVSDLLCAGAAGSLSRKVWCVPLASQRTLRVRSTAYDIKLSVNAALTSEHRLLFRLNCENAPAVSALVRKLLAAEREVCDFDIQADIASLAFGEAHLAPHLSAIIREPVRVGKDEVAIPAIELWTGRELALSFAGQASRFFREYCRVLLTGPVRFLLQYGLAFEPHLQNTIIVFRGRKPRRLVLRDLDGTIIDRRPVGRLAFADDTWKHMPSRTVGENRLVHSLFFGHLGAVIDFLTAKCDVSQEALLEILKEEWEGLPERLAFSREMTRRFDRLCDHLANGKRMLVARLERSPRMEFVRLPQHEVFPEDARRSGARKIARG